MTQVLVVKLLSLVISETGILYTGEQGRQRVRILGNWQKGEAVCRFLRIGELIPLSFESLNVHLPSLDNLRYLGRIVVIERGLGLIWQHLVDIGIGCPHPRARHGRWR